MMCVPEKEIISENPLFDMFKELSLFEQTNYCINYIKDNIIGIDDIKAIEQGEIASACFRQAKEYYEAGQKVSLSTRPLLYSYSMNNYTKGMAYLTTTDEDVLKGFKRHGFDYRYNSKFLETDIIKKSNGAVSSLEKMVQDKEIDNNKNIRLYSLLSLIPNMSSIFNETTMYISNIGFPYEFPYEYKVITRDKSFDTNELNLQGKLLGFTGTIVSQNKYRVGCLLVGLTIATQKNINNLKGLPYISDKHIFLPIIIDNDAVLVQPMVASYLIIMFYGMLVRYHAEKWDKIIDAKISDNYSLVKISVEECYNEFIVNLYRYIFKQRIIKKEYSDDSVKKYIENNKREILDMLEKEKENKKRQFGY